MTDLNTALDKVAPCAGAWIEILQLEAYRALAAGRPLRGGVD